MRFTTSTTKNTFAAAALAAAGAGTNTALAQGGPASDREIQAVAVLPGESAGTYDLHIVWSATIGPASVPTDLSTQFQVLVGTNDPLTSSVVDVAIDPGSGFCGGVPCSGGCGTGYIDGINAAAFLCIDCECKLPSVTTIVPTPLAPGDEIMVILYPAPGAQPDPDASDNVHTTTFNGDPIHWDRRIAAASATPTAGAPDSFFDIWVEPAVGANYDGVLALGGTLELWIDGVEHAETPVPALDLDLIWNQCANVACDDSVACVMGPSGQYYGTCQENPDIILPCSCEYHPEPSPVPDFPAVFVPAGAEIVVVLVPVPGALPELPGFPDDEEEVPLPNPCPADVNGDTYVDVQDMVELILTWGCTSPPDDCPADINADGIVDVEDLVAMLLAWGNCFPV